MDFKVEIKNLIRDKRWIEAFNMVDALDLSTSFDSQLLLICGKVYIENKLLNQAYDLLDRAFTIDPNNYEIALIFAEAAIESLQLQNAQRAVDKLMEIEPDGLDTLRLLYGLSQLRGKDPTELLGILERMKSIEYNEKYAYELAELYWQLGMIEKSKSECRRLINYFRGGPMVQKAKKLLDDLKEAPPNILGTDGVTNSKDQNTSPREFEDKPQEVKATTLRGLKNLFSQTIGPKVENKIEQTKINKSSSNQVQNIKEEILLPSEIAKEFEKLIGMESVKLNILSFVNEAKLDAKRREVTTLEKDKDRGYNFMILGNPGTGKTTVARIIAKILKMLEIRSSDNFVEVDKSGLVGKYIGETEDKVKNVLMQANEGTLFVDEAYTLYDKDNPKDFGREALNVIIKAMEDQRDSLTVIFAGYKKQMNEMLQANAGLESRIDFIIEVPDYSDEELLMIADKIAEEKALVITAPGKKAIKECITRQRIDEKFGNARFIRTLINDAYRNLANRLANTDHSHDEMFKLEAVDFGVKLDRSPEEEIEGALEELNSLIGLSGVKKQVNSIVNGIKVRAEMEKRGIIQRDKDLGTMHMIFTGNPGTGKTTVARIIGRIYKALGILKRGDAFVECTRGDLVGRYQGHTAEKTQDKIKESLGGILFIDEAYGLYQGENDSFGKEAIDTLIAEMENKRDKLMVILAGYQEQIAGLLEANPGFKSRINTYIHFEDYSEGELVEIFVAMVNQRGLSLAEGVTLELTKLFSHKCRDKDFGNARGVRNILETVIRNKNNRLASKMASGAILNEQDFLNITEQDVNDKEISYD